MKKAGEKEEKNKMELKIRERNIRKGEKRIMEKGRR